MTDSHSTDVDASGVPDGSDPAAPAPVPAEAEAAAPADGSKRGKKKKDEPKKQASLWKELPILVVVAIVLAFIIKTLFVQAFYIPSESMENTLHGCAGCTGDRVLVNKLVYDFRDPHRGEIVVFKRPPQTADSHWQDEPQTQSSNSLVRALRKAQSFIGLGGNPDESDFIKRVIGVGGDTVECPAIPTDATMCAGLVVNGHKIDESSYLFENLGQYNLPYQQAFQKVTVPKGDLFVLGDHRDDSEDSRFQGFVPVNDVIGKAFVKVWPPSRVGGLGVPKVWQQNLSDGIHVATAPPVIAAAGTLPVFFVRRRRRARSAAPRG